MSDSLTMRMVQEIKDLKERLRVAEEQVVVLTESQKVLTQVLMELVARG